MVAYVQPHFLINTKELAPSSNLDLPITKCKGTRSNVVHNISYSTANLNSSFVCFTTALPTISIPKSFVEAMQHPAWCRAIEHEMSALYKQKTWDLVHSHANYAIVGYHWVYSVNINLMILLND